MSDISGEIDAAESLIVELADEYVERLERGERPDLEEYVARWPGDPRVLRQVLASLKLVRLSSVVKVGGAALEAVDAAGRLGDFQILREIGRGGMGVVYEAEQLSLGRRIALKILPFAGVLDPRQLTRFKNEALAAAQLDHPNIVDVIAVGCDRGIHYYAMRLIEGPTLAEVIGELRGSAARSQDADDHCKMQIANCKLQIELTTDNSKSKIENPKSTLAGISTETLREYFRSVARLMAEAADALDHAHQSGVVHRDIKPSNLMLDSRGKVWVTDFGLAHVESNSEMTMTGDVLGTLRYMSPEQAGGNVRLVDHRTDVYSLGATLYELLSFLPAFGSTDRHELLRQIAEVEPVALRKTRRSVPADLETIALKALEKEPTHRYATAAELAEDLRRFLDERPIKARRPSLTQRAVKWSRRHASAVAAATLVLLIALMAAAGLLWRENDWTKANLKLAENANREQTRLTQIAEIAAKHERGQAKLAEKARGQAEEEKRRAEEEKRIADAVRNFLQNDLLRQADSDAQADALRVAKGGFEVGENPTIKELLDRAAAQLTPEKIERRFPGLPRVQAEILVTIGDAYRGIGDYLEWERHLARAAEIFQATLGDGHPDTLVARRSLADAFGMAHKLDSAIPLYERTLKEMEVRLGSDDARTLATRHHLANAYRAGGKMDLAIPLLIRTRKAVEATLGDDNPETLVIGYHLAEAYTEAGQLDLAIPLLLRTLKAAEATLGDDHPVTLATRNALAWAYQEASKLDVAIPIFEAIVVKVTEMRGPYHPYTLACQNNLAVAYWVAGRLDRSVPLLEELLKSRREKLGPDHQSTLVTQGVLGSCYSDLGRVNEGIAMMEEAVERSHALPGALPYEFLVVQKVLGDAYASAGLLAKAAAAYVAALDDLRRIRGDEAHVTIGDKSRCAFTARNGLGLVYWWQGKYEQAELVLSELLAEMRTVLGNEDQNTLNVMDNLAKQYREQRKFELAVPLFQESLEGKQRVLGGEHPSTLTTVHNLGACHLAAGDPEKAMPLLRASLLVRQKNAPDDWFTFNAQSVLGSCLLAEGKYGEAEPLLVGGYEGMKHREADIPSTSRMKLPEALERLMQLYTAWEKPDKAAMWRAANPVALAYLAASRKHHRAAAELYREASQRSPDLASDPANGNRYKAACAATLAMHAEGTDASELAPDERDRWRKQALEWLQSDLAAWRDRLTAATSEKAQIVPILQHWQRDPDLKSVRDEAAVAALPEEQRRAWASFWTEVERTLCRCF